MFKTRLGNLNAAKKNRLVHAGQFMSGRVMSSNDNPERIGLNISTLNPNIFSDNIQIKSITNDLYLFRKRVLATLTNTLN